VSAEPSPHVLVIGLGAMGLPIALRLHAAGFAVSGIDAQAAALDALARAGARAIAAGTVRDAVQSMRQEGGATAARLTGMTGPIRVACMTCVSDEDALLKLWQAPGGLREALAPGLCVIDHTTTGIATARQLAADAASAGAAWLDAPLSGAAAGARAGTLSAMLGGEPDAVERARPLLAAYCAAVTHLGPAGAGQAAKLANQLAIAGTNAGLLAAAGFAAAQGLDLSRCFDALAAGSAHSAQMDQHREALTRAPADIAHFDWLRRDLALARAHLPGDAAGANGATHPLLARLFALYEVFDGTPAPPLL
jgi:3-hydroxyisobutyrate dehydrogenase